MGNLALVSETEMTNSSFKVKTLELVFLFLFIVINRKEKQIIYTV